MDQSREQHNNLVYMLWLDDPLYQWTDPTKSRLYVQKAIDRVDAPELLKFTVYARSRNGLTPLIDKGATGVENIYRALDEMGHD